MAKEVFVAVNVGWAALGVAAIGLSAGCGGSNCDAGYPISVTVSDPEGALMDDATVTLINTTDLSEQTCSSVGSGEYECLADQTGDYNVYAEKTSFEARGQAVSVPDDTEDCAEPVVSVSFMLARESGV